MEYIEFNEMKLVEQLKQLDCPELVKVLHVNRFGPAKLELVGGILFHYMLAVPF